MDEQVIPAKCIYLSHTHVRTYVRTQILYFLWRGVIYACAWRWKSVAVHGGLLQYTAATPAEKCIILAANRGYQMILWQAATSISA